MKRRVAVVVLNWNGCADTVACLESLEPAVQRGVARVVVVDNASTDGSPARIRDWITLRSHASLELQEQAIGGRSSLIESFEYALICATRNAGYASGNNLGIRLALDVDETEFVFVLNNDTVVERDCIEHLTRWADEHADAGVVGCTVIEGDLVIAGGNTFNPISTRSRPVRVRPGLYQSQIDYVSGAAQFIRVEAIRKVGLLSEDYFLYFEELDLTRRLCRAGFKITWCPMGIVHHAGGRSAGSRSRVSRKSSLAEYHSNLSCLIFLRRFYPRLLWLAATTRFFGKIVHDLLVLQPTLVVPMVTAYRDYFLARRRHA